MSIQSASLARLENSREKLRLQAKSEAFSGQAAGSTSSASRALCGYYRCPESVFHIELNGELSSKRGYFQFGPEVVGYGRSCTGSGATDPSAKLPDLFANVTVASVSAEPATVRLPFDAAEVIDNLRLERYARAFHGMEGVLRKLYYCVRPLTTRAMRRRVQQFHARDWRQKKFPHWPVDTTVETLSEKLMLLALQARGVERVPFIWFWPGGARGCVTMTHDVETAEGRDYCGPLMDLDDAFGIKASFQIVPEDRYEVPEKFLASIRDRGFEIGVQDLNHDGRLFDNREEFLRRARIISRYGREYGARGFRAGVLYRKPEWYDALEFSYEMSIPNVAHLDPQSGGCCTVMPYFIGHILELPVTTIQDYTLFHLLGEHTIDLWKQQLELILAKNGMASFIVHPDYVIEPEPRRVYQELLAHLRDRAVRDNLWVALPSEIDGWWRSRSEMSVVPDGESFRIEGKGAERAVLAFAKNVDGKLIYELADSAARS